MLVVAVDTSTAAVTAAVVDIDRSGSEPATSDQHAGHGRLAGTVAELSGRARVRCLAERRQVDARAHGELLAPTITACLDSAGVVPRELAAIVAGVGPGPYTGLRVGLATAAAMAQALAVPAYGVCSLDGIGARTSGCCLVATDARRREVYWAVYADGARVSGPEVSRPADLASIVAERGLAPTSAAGEGALRYADVLWLPTVGDHAYPSPVALAELAAGLVLARAGGQSLTPLYLRRPDAAEPGTRKLVTR